MKADLEDEADSIEKSVQRVLAQSIPLLGDIQARQEMIELLTSIKLCAWEANQMVFWELRDFDSPSVPEHYAHVVAERNRRRRVASKHAPNALISVSIVADQEATVEALRFGYLVAKKLKKVNNDRSRRSYDLPKVQNHMILEAIRASVSQQHRTATGNASNFGMGHFDKITSISANLIGKFESADSQRLAKKTDSYYGQLLRPTLAKFFFVDLLGKLREHIHALIMKTSQEHNSLWSGSLYNEAALQTLQSSLPGMHLTIQQVVELFERYSNENVPDGGWKAGRGVGTEGIEKATTTGKSTFSPFSGLQNVRVVAWDDLDVTAPKRRRKRSPPLTGHAVPPIRASESRVLASQRKLYAEETMQQSYFLFAALSGTMATNKVWSVTSAKNQTNSVIIAWGVDCIYAELVRMRIADLHGRNGESSATC